MSIETSDDERLRRDPLVSVLMLTYNHGPYIAEAIESVVSQRAPFAFELLIGDDFSSDDTLDVALHYQALHPDKVRVITDTHNVGMHENHSRLIVAARGEYVAWCEGDDYWIDPDKLAQQALILADHPRAGLVHSDFTHIRQVSGRWRAKEGMWSGLRAIPRGEVFDELIVGNFIQTCTMMARTRLVREFLDTELASNGYKVADWPLCLAISASNEVLYIDAPMAAYRHVPGSATNSGHLSEVARAEDSMRMATDVIREFQKSRALVTRAHAQAQRHILGLALRSGDRRTAQAALTWIDRDSPASISGFERTISKAVVRSAFVARLLHVVTSLAGRASIGATYRDPVPPPSRTTVRA